MPRRIVATFALLCLAACGQPVPAEKSAYVGSWEGPHVSLRIEQGGNVDYKRVEGSMSKSIAARIKAFNGDNFEVGVGPISTTFVVSAKPHMDGEAMKMTVDGVELTRQR